MSQTTAELVFASIGFVGFFALGIASIVVPRRVGRFFQVGGGPLLGPRLAAKMFSTGRIRYTGCVLTLMTPFMAWGAVTNILA